MCILNDLSGRDLFEKEAKLLDLNPIKWGRTESHQTQKFSEGSPTEMNQIGFWLFLLVPKKKRNGKILVVLYIYIYLFIYLFVYLFIYSFIY